MNRRNFLGSLAVLPFFGSLAKSADTKPKKVVMSSMYGTMRQPLDPFMIMSAYDIGDAGFAFTDTPTFEAYGEIYSVKLWKLKVACCGIPDIHAIHRARLQAVGEITRLGITHVHSVRFFESPIIMPDWSHRYCAYVRGARVRPWYVVDGVERWRG